MHQKNSQDSAAFGGSYNGFDEEDEDEEDDDVDEDEGRNAADSFADVDDDDLDDDLDEDEPQRDSRGGWWRGVVGRAPGTGDPDDSDDEEFGEFAMAEEDKSGNSSGAKEGADNTSSSSTTPDKVLLKPLAVNPMKEAARGLSGLWPFGSRTDSTTTTTTEKAGVDDEEEEEGEVVVPAAGEGKHSYGQGGPIEAKEGIRRESIEEVDDDEVVNVK